MRISDWSSDVCSSDLSLRRLADQRYGTSGDRRIGGRPGQSEVDDIGGAVRILPRVLQKHRDGRRGTLAHRMARRIELREGKAARNRSEERRVGKECGSTCRYGWSPDS